MHPGKKFERGKKMFENVKENERGRKRETMT
jgi:hypothetical protein